jgi:GNAT superfamily N-acetyltransferase
VIELREVAYDDPVAQVLVAALQAEIDERYAYAIAEMTPEEQALDAAEYLTEVQPEHVRPPYGAFLVAWLDDRPVGCGAVKPLDRALGVGEVKRMYTVPAARRRGVSRALLAALEARAAELGYRGLQLETGTAQPEALALYESAGWDRIPPYGRYKDAPDSVCYAKVLVEGDPPPLIGVASDHPHHS